MNTCCEVPLQVHFFDNDILLSISLMFLRNEVIEGNWGGHMKGNVLIDSDQRSGGGGDWIEQTERRMR
jgi:hypothetical protein